MIVGNAGLVRIEYTADLRDYTEPCGISINVGDGIEYMIPSTKCNSLLCTSCTNILRWEQYAYRYFVLDNICAYLDKIRLTLSDVM